MPKPLFAQCCVFYIHTALLFSSPLLFKPLSRSICAGSGKSGERLTWIFGFKVKRFCSRSPLIFGSEHGTQTNGRDDSLSDSLYFFPSALPAVLLILSSLDCRCVGFFFCHLIRDFDFYIGLRPREPKRKTVDCISHNATPRFQPFSALWPEPQKLWSCAGFFLTSHLCERHNKKPVYVFFFFFKKSPPRRIKT